MKRPRLARLLAALCMCAAPAFAQMSILPEPCVGKTGEALDKCVREITPVTRTQRLEPVEPAADPTQIINCDKVNRADQEFCIARNEIILECRNRIKHPDFDQCISSSITRPPPPRVADCSRVKTELRNECFARNKVYQECVPDPLRYFICLGKKLTKK